MSPSLSFFESTYMVYERISMHASIHTLMGNLPAVNQHIIVISRNGRII